MSFGRTGTCRVENQWFSCTCSDLPRARPDCCMWSTCLHADRHSLLKRWTSLCKSGPDSPSLQASYTMAQWLTWRSKLHAFVHSCPQGAGWWPRMSPPQWDCESDYQRGPGHKPHVHTTGAAGKVLHGPCPGGTCKSSENATDKTTWEHSKVTLGDSRTKLLETHRDSRTKLLVAIEAQGSKGSGRTKIIKKDFKKAVGLD